MAQKTAFVGVEKEYCDRCRENGYNDWKWRGVLKNEENH